jgi:undecaprenyl-diphosphatase
MEQQLLLLINRQWTNPALDLFMAALSSWDVWIVPLTVAAVCVLMFGAFKGRAFLVVVGLLVGINDGVVSQSLKKIVQRPRPHEVLADVRQVSLRPTEPALLAMLSLFKKPRAKLSHPKPGEQGGNSFPSSHTANNFCFAMALTAFFRRWGWLSFALAACVGYSRVYVGSHWPSDALASAFLGTGLALLCLPLCELVWRKCTPRLAPEMARRHPTLLGDAVA